MSSIRQLCALHLALCAFAAGCAEQGVAPVASTVVADSSDQILEGMTTTITKNGVTQSVVYADTTYMYTDQQLAVLRRLRSTFFDAQGAPTAVLTAKRGNYQFGRGTLEAWDSVFIQSMDGSNRRLRTAHLIYDRDQNQIRSDSAFVYESPTEVLTGKSFISDPGFKNVVTRQPKGRQRGEGMLLPGQKP
jgi:LPS export ABC transporter protein LptC